MKFKIVDTYRYDWPVTVQMPDQARPGHMASFTFVGTFEAIGRDEALELQRNFAALKTDAEKEAHEHDLMRRVFVGWNEDVVDESGQPVPFSRAAFERCMQLSWFRIGLYRAHAASISADPRLGN